MRPPVKYFQKSTGTLPRGRFMDRQRPGLLNRGAQSQKAAHATDGGDGGVSGQRHDRETRGEEPQKIRSHPRDGSMSDGATRTEETIGRAGELMGERRGAG